MDEANCIYFLPWRHLCFSLFRFASLCFALLRLYRCAAAACSPSQMSQIVWWVSFVTATTEDGFVESSADVCSSYGAAALYHPADVLGWRCECTQGPPLAKSSMRGSGSPEPRHVHCRNCLSLYQKANPFQQCDAVEVSSPRDAPRGVKFPSSMSRCGCPLIGGEPLVLVREPCTKHSCRNDRWLFPDILSGYPPTTIVVESVIVRSDPSWTKQCLERQGLQRWRISEQNSLCR